MNHSIMTTQHEEWARFFTMDVLDGHSVADLSGWPDLGPGELDLPSLDFSMSTSVTTPEDPAWFPFQPVLTSIANIPENEQCGRCEKLLRRLDEVSTQQEAMEESQRRNGVLLGMLVGAVSDLGRKLDSLTGTNAESSETTRHRAGLLPGAMVGHRQGEEGVAGPAAIDKPGTV